MEYYISMHVVVETPGYLKDAEAIFTTQEREAIITMVARDPACGELMQGTGGVRKVRVGRGGRGKAVAAGSSTFTMTQPPGLPARGLREKREGQPQQG
jgi:hypothetical protein